MNTGIIVLSVIFVAISLALLVASIIRYYGHNRKKALFSFNGLPFDQYDDYVNDSESHGHRIDSIEDLSGFAECPGSVRVNSRMIMANHEFEIYKKTDILP